LAEETDSTALNYMAWQLATSTNPDERDGAAAVWLAEKSVQIAERKEAVLLDTLAAAYAESGQFSAAVNAQTEALTLLKQSNAAHPMTVEKYAARLALYLQGLPFRQE
jgi:N-acyl-D-aspartate/D-glutamate deacylase